MTNKCCGNCSQFHIIDTVKREGRCCFALSLPFYVEAVDILFYDWADPFHLTEEDGKECSVWEKKDD